MSNTDIQSAIERARAVAAKLSQAIPSSGGSPSQKRSLDSDGPAPNKKFASVDDAVGANLAMLKAQQNGQITEEIKVPDKMVGLVIGKGGSQLHQLQDETGCKVAIAQSSNNGQVDRVFTIVGRDRQSIQQCKKRIEEIIRRGQTGPGGHQNGGGGGGGNVEVMEMLIPGNKCGVVIGKGGETIKRLNEEYGVKMILIQDADTPLQADKPLRITGEPDRVARVKDAIMQLINPPAHLQGGRGGPGGGYRGGDDRGEYGNRRGGGDRYDGGDKRGGGDRYGGGGGYGKDNGASPSPASSGGANYGMPVCSIKVPGDRAGFVIGKGGETIKDINRRSGAHVEIDKTSRELPNGADKYFNLRGLPEQIQYAQQLIYEKITGIPGSVPPAGYFGPGSEVPGLGGAGGASANAYGSNLWAAQSDPNTAAWAAYYQQYYGQMAGAQPAAAPAATAPGAAPAAAAPAGGDKSGQADYSQQWIEYYRSLGMHDQAEAILKQIQV